MPQPQPRAPVLDVDVRKMRYKYLKWFTIDFNCGVLHTRPWEFRFQTKGNSVTGYQGKEDCTVGKGSQLFWASRYISVIHFYHPINEFRWSSKQTKLSTVAVTNSLCIPVSLPERLFSGYRLFMYRGSTERQIWIYIYIYIYGPTNGVSTLSWWWGLSVP
jgi:hypothetical protein